MIRRALAGWLMIVLLTACSPTSAGDWHAKWGGPYDFYVQIFDETDCAVLEAAVVRQVQGVGSLRTRQEVVDVAASIQAAYRRMVDLGCGEAFQ